MSKKHRKQKEEATPRRYYPPACSLCVTHRKPGTNYTRCNGTKVTNKIVVRYLRCDFCGHTWPVMESLDA